MENENGHPEEGNEWSFIVYLDGRPASLYVYGIC
jgi:hypothetical protein